MAHNSWEIRKHCVRRRSRDIISELPDEILLQILSSIPTKDVVKTSILSKRWKSLWTSVDAIEITDFNSPTAALLDVKKAGFMNFIGNVLNQVVFVRKLGLSSNYFHDVSRVKQLIDIVTSKLDDNGALDELDLNISACEHVELPLRIFTNKKLVILKLSDGVEINSQSSSSMVVWLPSLKVIHFHSVKILDISFVENILAGCPVLEVLSLKGLLHNKLEKERLCVKSSSLKSLTLRSLCLDGNMLNIEIDATNLEELNLSFKQHMGFVNVKNTNLPFLNRFRLNLRYWYSTYANSIGFYENTAMELLRKTPNIKYLFLSFDCRASNFVRFLEVLPMFKNLMHLKLDFDVYSFHIIYSLLKIAPNLVSFVLHCKDLWLQPEQFRTPDNNGLMLEFLETVELTIFRESDKEMDLVTYFLKNAPVLKKMTILFISGEVGAHLLHSRIVELPKASIACEVILR